MIICNQTSGAAESGRIRKAREFVLEHFYEELSLSNVAKAANTSANYLSEKFKEATGINFVKYVAWLRYQKAATLLRETDLRVSEIAFASGFQSLSQFNRVFKKFSGKSPTGYRTAPSGRAEAALAVADGTEPGQHASPSPVNSTEADAGMGRSHF